MECHRCSDIAVRVRIRVVGDPRRYKRERARGGIWGRGSGIYKGLGSSRRVRGETREAKEMKTWMKMRERTGRKVVASKERKVERGCTLDRKL